MSQLSYPLASAQPLNGWQLMTALINGEKAPSNAWKNLVSPEVSRPFAAQLAYYQRPAQHPGQQPAAGEILSAQPNLPCKLHRPYLAANMSKIECLFALRDHYDLIAQRMPLKMRLGHLGPQSFVLARAMGKTKRRSRWNWQRSTS